MTHALIHPHQDLAAPHCKPSQPSIRLPGVPQSGQTLSPDDAGRGRGKVMSVMRWPVLERRCYHGACRARDGARAAEYGDLRVSNSSFCVEKVG